ncbi:MAG: endonuclease/exonuclease/phosphatase family protein [Flavobacteriales bacterium]
MRKILFLILVLSTTLLKSQNLNNLGFGTDSTFEVISWNIEWFPKNGTTTSNYVETILSNLQADIYALQEIGDTTLLKSVVANIPGYECHFKSSYYGGLAYVYNTNTVSINNKYEIYTSQPYWSAFPRSPQVLELTFEGEDYVIINNHFKCCGDGTLNTNDPSDEEMRRLTAVTLLKQYIDSVFINGRVIVVGDLNDILTDSPTNNVFQSIINDNMNYMFTDMQIALGNPTDFSYPTWPSHLDHILITNELFIDFQNPNSEIRCIKIDDYMNNWNQYDNNISDHRPIGIKLEVGKTTSDMEIYSTNKELIKIVDVLGKEVEKRTKGILFYIYNNGMSEKKIIIE